MKHLKTFESYESPMSKEEMISHLCNCGWEKHELEDKHEEELSGMCREVPSEMSESKSDKWIADDIEESDFKYDELRFIKEIKDYKGYLTGSLVHLYKHKSELQNEINSLEIKIGSQSLMNSLLPSRNKALMIHQLTKELSVLKKELSEVSDDIAKHNKSKY